MIGQYLSNTNERATVSILQNILELNKASFSCSVGGSEPCHVLPTVVGSSFRFFFHIKQFLKLFVKLSSLIALATQHSRVLLVASQVYQQKKNKVNS